MADITVEFFGLARSRTGTDAIELSATTLADIVQELVRQYPALAESCFRDGQLGDSWLFNLNGQQFTRDTDTRLDDGDSIMLMSADAGG